ncbi:maleylpyruvate isomerase family mycothiol-dependent enzyme [Nocardia carnea]|uniref:maleylpyruvate isomerase family mycothiol-dependent enzyme n=1 Tax=Nocardia carnea TaxID=37328 RepID=UPI00245378D2|nr:maleylpyruvate isomerase family mycothiol-dependent enzyme [Nocardia carnea]
MIPLDVRPVFRRERQMLLDLLRSLDSADWQKPTVCPGWSVADVTAHLLNDYLRRISGSRDGHGGAVFADDETLPAYLARVNGEFVNAMRQCSPRVLTDLLAQLGPELDRVWAATADLAGPARLNVSWAGTGTSPAWLDIAREYTEFWVHQQQIRDAVSRRGADDIALMRPVLVAFLHAVPWALRDRARPQGTAVRFEITGPAGGCWSVVSDGTSWDLTAVPAENPAATVRMDQDSFWRLATRGITVDQARRRSELRGDPELAESATTLLAVVA